MEKPVHLIELSPLTPDQELSFKENLCKERDAQQDILNEARRMRTDLRLKSRDRYIDFLQKIGELSLTFGAALIPLIVVTNSRKDIKTPAFALAGAAIYLANGVLSFWLTKLKIEQDGDDTPHVGLDEEIMTYPLIYAKNKLILEPYNVSYANEHIDAEWNITHQPVIISKKRRPSIWIDALLFNFVIASVLIAGTLWPYRMRWYWLMLVVMAMVMLTLIALDYRRAVKSQKDLRQKHEKIAKIKGDFGEWRTKKMSGR